MAVAKVAHSSASPRDVARIRLDAARAEVEKLERAQSEAREKLESLKNHPPHHDDDDETIRRRLDAEAVAGKRLEIATLRLAEAKQDLGSAETEFETVARAAERGDAEAYLAEIAGRFETEFRERAFALLDYLAAAIEAERELNRINRAAPNGDPPSPSIFRPLASPPVKHLRIVALGARGETIWSSKETGGPESSREGG